MSPTTPSGRGTRASFDVDVARRGASFRAGILLIVVSYAIYPAYPTIAMLPISTEAKVASGIAGWSMSWVLFALGTILAGSAGRDVLRRLSRRPRRGGCDDAPAGDRRMLGEAGD